MSKRLNLHRHLFLATLGVWPAACSLDSELPGRNGSAAAPVSSGVTLSGAGTPVIDAGYGESSRISDIAGSTGDPRSSAGGVSGRIDSASDPGEGVGETGNAASGAAGVGGSAGAAGAGEEEPPPVLWFSEYIEGSSTNKAIEITAANRARLDGCKVASYFNGKTEATVIATLSGVLEAGQVLTLCTSALKEKLAATCSQVGNLTFNGDDAIALSCDGVLLDVIGQIGVDPGEAWGSDPNTTADHTLRRQCTVQGGDPQGTDAFNPSTEWEALPVDTFDGLGTRGC